MRIRGPGVGVEGADGTPRKIPSDGPGRAARRGARAAMAGRGPARQATPGREKAAHSYSYSTGAITKLAPVIEGLRVPHGNRYPDGHFSPGMVVTTRRA